MAIFEVTAHGFDGGSDLTDDRVFWVISTSRELVEDCIVGTGAELWGEGIGVLGDEDLVDFRLPSEQIIFKTTLLKFLEE